MKAMTHKKKHIFRTILLIILGMTAVFLLFSFIRHRVMLEGEKDHLTPPGQMVDVDGYKMHVYSVGEGEKTLVLMAASGTVCPSLFVFKFWIRIEGSLRRSFYIAIFAPTVEKIPSNIVVTSPKEDMTCVRMPEVVKDELEKIVAYKHVINVITAPEIEMLIMAGGGVALIGITLVLLLSGLF